MRFRSYVYLKFCIAKFGCSVTEPDTWSYTMSLSVSMLGVKNYQCDAILYNSVISDTNVAYTSNLERYQTSMSDILILSEVILLL